MWSPMIDEVAPVLLPDMSEWNIAPVYTVSGWQLFENDPR